MKPDPTILPDLSASPPITIRIPKKKITRPTSLPTAHSPLTPKIKNMKPPESRVDSRSPNLIFPPHR